MSIKPPQKPIKIGLVQMTSVDNVGTNVKAVLQALDGFRGQKCDLICLPENALYLRLDKKNKTDGFMNLRENFWRDFQAYADKEKCFIFIGSVAYKNSAGKTAKQKAVNATVLVSPGRKPQMVYEKIHLFDVDVAGAPPSRESDVFNHGKKPKILKINGWNIGLSICYDLRFAELYSYYAQKNVHLILVPSAFLVPTGKAHWHVLLRARAIESQAFIVAVAQCGGHKNLSGQTRETYGHSLAVGPWGNVLVDMGDQGAASGVIELRPEDIVKTHAQIPMASHRQLASHRKL